MNLQSLIRDVPNFPKDGIVFKDFTPLLKDPAGLKALIQQLAAPFKDKGIQKVCGIESRGFILGVPLALELGAGFVPVRKPGKLPAATVSQSYSLEYGTDTLRMHRDSLEHGERVLLVDDVIATGGTAEATLKMIHELGGQVVAAVFMIELSFLNGRSKLGSTPIHSVWTY